MSAMEPHADVRRGVQAALILRLHAVLLPMAVFLVALRADRGPKVLLPGGVLIVCLAYGLWALRRGQRWGPFRAYGLVALLSSFELYWGLVWSTGGVPPVLILLGSTGLLLQLCWSPRAGWSAFGLGLVTMVVVYAFKGPFSPHENNFFMDLGLSMLGLQASAWAYDKVLSRSQEALLAQQSILERLAKARGRLVTALLDNLELPLKWAGRGELPDADLAQQLSRGLAEAHKLRDSMDLVEGGAVDLHLSRRMLVPLLGLGILIAAVEALRDLWTRQPDAYIGVSLTAFLLLLLLYLWRRPQAWTGVAAGTIVASYIAFVLAVQSTPVDRVPTVLNFGTLLIAFAAFWLGMRSALATLVAMLALDAWVLWGRGAAFDVGARSILINFMEQWLSVAFIIAPAVQAQQGLLERLDRQASELAANLRVQRRLLGTLFHDAANHVMALGQLADLAELSPDAADRERFERLLDRLGRLVGSARDWLYLDKPFDAAQLQAVAAESLAHAMQDLFADRLRAKHLTLRWELPTGLGLKGLPALLSDGVLGNLFSNAIKFSPRGSEILLQGGAQEGFAWLAVLDRGPGLPPGTIEALKRHEDLPSLTGSEGETGQGLGLGLAREHLKRMGGRLELAAREGGGTTARLWMPVAQ